MLNRISTLGGSKIGSRAALAAGVALFCSAALGQAQNGFEGAASAPVFSLGQAQEGAQAYAESCAICHGPQLEGSAIGPTLKGRPFLAQWGSASLEELYRYIHRNMPPGSGGSLEDQAYASILAFIMQQNGVEPGERPLPSQPSLLAGFMVPQAPPERGRFADMGLGGVAQRVPVPEWPSPPDRFANFTPVTKEMLTDPAPENWLAWRRSHRGQGFSPLHQITTENVDDLQIAWAVSLPAGPNTSEPLVRDGVLYVYTFGEGVMALDAASGELLWRYERDVPEGTNLVSKKTLALHGDKLFLSTSDLHLVALNARTGRPVWDRKITDKPGYRNPGGPLAADGVVMNGLATVNPNGGLIAGFDAETGEHLWTFNTIAMPGEPGGDTWNDAPPERRNGGSVWNSGTFDAETGLALWGTAQTYDTAPLRWPKEGANNDGLYTDSTLALEPRTGKLVWHFQHTQNDQWDFDAVFERVIGEIDVNGARRRVIISGGKEGLFDVIDAETGGYLQTVDLGLQNFVTAIDPKTGRRTYDPALIPGGHDHTITVCPHGGGGRNWLPTAFNPETAALFVVARDVCMDMVPVEEGGYLSAGVNVQTSVREGSDGRYGLMRALDTETGKILWEWRQRTVHTSGVLATAGGLAFVGSRDRKFKAHDQKTGEVLWESGVSQTPNGSPISYAVDGKQYIALVTGHGSPLTGGLGELVPEVGNPPVGAATLYVFGLPE